LELRVDEMVDLKAALRVD
jgi:hypothetical protein